MKRKDPIYKNEHILLLDDNELDNFINQKIVEANNFSKVIYVNTGGKSALEFLKNLSVLSTDLNNFFPNVIFVDINMPMMDGFQFIQDFKKLYPEKSSAVKLIILSSSVNPDDVKVASEISEDILFLHKPLTQEMLNQI